MVGSPAFSFALVITLALPAVVSFTQPPPDGDWVIADVTSISNQTVVIDGNITVQNGGVLDLTDATIIMECAIDKEYFIDVMSGGELRMDRSCITSSRNDCFYQFFIQGNASIKDSTIEYVWGSQAPGPGGVEISSDNVTVSDTTVRYCKTTGISLSNFNPSVSGSNIINNGQLGIYCYLGTCANIDNNTIADNNDTGIYIDDTSAPTIDGNQIIRNYNCGIDNQQYSRTMITHNYISKSNDGIVNDYSSNVTIKNNTIEYCIIHGIASFSSSTPNITGNDLNYNQGAIYSTGYANVTMEDNIIDYCNLSAIENNYFCNVTIVGNSIYYNLEGGIFNYGHSVSYIDNNKIYDNNEGINDKDSFSNTIINNEIHDNILTGIDDYSQTGSSYIFNNSIFNNKQGIKNLMNCSAIIENNRIFKNNDYGILNVRNSRSMIYNNSINESGVGIGNQLSTVTMSGNQIFNNDYGVLNNDSSEPTITNNSIYSNLKAGIFNENDVTALIADNMIFNNSQDGINASGKCNLALSNNNISGNGRNGMCAVDHCMLAIDGNTISDNEIGLSISSSNGTISCNTFRGGMTGIHVTDSSPFISNSTLSNLTYGIQFLNSSANLESLSIENIKGCSFVCNQTSSPTIVNSTVTPNVGSWDFWINDNSHPIALNSQFDQRGGVHPDETSSLLVEWYLRFIVDDSYGRPMSSANVTIEGKDLIRKTTDENGALPWIPLEDKTIKKNGDEKASYRITIELVGDSTVYSNITLNRSEERNLTFDFRPNIRPIPEQYFPEDAQYTLNLSDYISDKDNEIANLIVSLTNGSERNSNVSLNGKNLIFNYSLPTDKDVIFFGVSDGIRNATGSVIVHVEPVNDAPQFRDPGTLELIEDVPYVLDLSRYISDEDDALENLTIRFESEYASLNGLNMTLDYPNGITEDQIEIVVSDGKGGVCRRVLDIKITAVNDAPVIPNMPTISPVEDIELVVDFFQVIKDPDTPLSNITITTNSSYINVDGLKLRFLYPEAVLRDYVQINVSDGQNWTVYDIVISVTPVNDPPVLRAIPRIVVIAGKSYTMDLSVWIWDPDSPIENVSIYSLSPCISVKGFNITLNYPANTTLGMRFFQLTLTDGMNSTDLEIPVNITAPTREEKIITKYAVYIYILVPLAIIGTAAGIIAYRRLKYGWYEVKRALIVYEDGRMIAHAGERTEEDNEMLVSGMLTAVQQYIDEAMKDEKAGAIKEFQYEDMRIAVERGKKIYLAVFLKGYTTERLRREMKGIVDRIETKHKTALSRWDGRMTNVDFIMDSRAQLKALVSDRTKIDSRPRSTDGKPDYFTGSKEEKVVPPQPAPDVEATPPPAADKVKVPLPPPMAEAGTGLSPVKKRTARPASLTPVSEGTGVALKGELEFYQGFVRLKVAVKNSMPTTITGTDLKLVYNHTALRLDHVEPGYGTRGDEVVLGVVEPKEKKTVAFYLDPMICTESYIEGVLTYKDAHGNLEILKMPRKMVSVVCPILYTEQNINTAMLRRMIAEELDKKDSKVFTVPQSMTPQKAFEIGKAAVQHHDLRHVREFCEKEPYVGEAWYYGTAKGRPDRLVVRVRVMAEQQGLEFHVASSSTLMVTGMLAELKSDLADELTMIEGSARIEQVTDARKVDALVGVRSLLEKELDGEVNPETA